MADRTLVVKLVGDERDLLRSYSRSEKATKDFGRATDTVAVKADKQAKRLRTAGAGIAGGFIATEVISTLDVFIDKAGESERVLTQVRQGLQNTGQSWDRYKDIIDDTVTSQSRLGFDDEALLESFDKFNRSVGDVTQALRLNNLAMDVARGRNIELEAATNLVVKASSGQRGALTRLGIVVDKNADKTELLRVLTEKYGGSAEAAADNAATAQERLAVSLENVQESIGTLLLPTVGRLADELAGASETASDVVENLQDLGNLKIPVINVPINFELPGTDTTIGRVIRRVFGETNPITGRTSPIGGLRTIRQAGDLFRGDDGPSNTSQPVTSRSMPPINITVPVVVDGKVIAQVTKKYNQRDSVSNPPQKRGGNWRR